MQRSFSFFLFDATGSFVIIGLLIVSRVSAFCKIAQIVNKQQSTPFVQNEHWAMFHKEAQLRIIGFQKNAQNSPSRPLFYEKFRGKPNYMTLFSNKNNDWIEAELTLHNFPNEPSPDLSPNDVLRSCLRSLQFIDHPTPSAGLHRIFPFFTWECRKVVTARKGGDTIERFMEHGLLSPALQPFMGATRIEFGEETLTKGSSTRGDLISYPITVHGSTVLQFQHSSGFIKDGVSLDPPVTNMVVRLEKNRRPPMQGCWLVREVLDVRYAFAGDMGNAHVGG